MCAGAIRGVRGSRSERAEAALERVRDPRQIADFLETALPKVFPGATRKHRTYALHYAIAMLKEEGFQFARDATDFFYHVPIHADTPRTPSTRWL